MTLLTIENNELRLNTNLDEYTFGKTAHDAVLSQEGVIFDGKNFRQWTFEEVKSYDVEREGRQERLVFYCAENPLGDAENAKTLAQFYEEGGENALAAVHAVCAALTAAAKDGNTIPMVGAGGIIIAGEKVLFAPETLFNYAINTLTPEDAVVQNHGFLNETISGLPALCFERAAIIYRLLTQNVPFGARDSIARNADIFDHNFLPIEYCVNGIDSELAALINNSLRLTSTEVNVPGKKKKGKSSEDLTPTKTFPLENLLHFRKEPLKDSKLSDQEFEEKVQNYIKLRDVKINAKRKIRRNVTKIVIGVIAVFTLAIVISSTIKNNLDDYSSKGLTSTETIEAYYKAMNLRDAVLMGAMTKGKNTQRYVDSVSQVYVMGRARQASSRDLGFVSPENWLLFVTDRNKNSQASIFGVSNVKIDGKLSNLNPELHKKIEKIPALQSENGITLADQSQSVHSVEYYFLISEGETNEISIEKINATITLTYVKDKWLITDIEPVSTKIDLNNFTFKSEYFYSVSENNGDVIKAVGELRNKYSWLPSDEVLKIEQIRLEEERNFPMKSLGL